MIKQIFKEAVIIILAAAVAALVVNSFRDQGLPLIGPDGTVTHKHAGNTEDAIAVREITMQKAMAVFRADSALFADARGANEFNSGHIKGAVSLPEEQFDQWIGAFLENTDPGVTIITYCEGYYCPLAKKLALKLMMAGFENVYYLPDGWGNWNKFRMPVETGE
ncbi:MAG: rhodanese-like domain-containing protein [Planctomycetota bacterium]|jgi:rhodanese-related sulfurtransferase